MATSVRPNIRKTTEGWKGWLAWTGNSHQSRRLGRTRQPVPASIVLSLAQKKTHSTVFDRHFGGSAFLSLETIHMISLELLPQGLFRPR